MKRVKQEDPVNAQEAVVDAETAAREAKEKQAAIISMLSESYAAKLEHDMEKLHNQFVAFISAAELPLPQTLLVLQILVRETIDQAHTKYIGG